MRLTFVQMRRNPVFILTNIHLCIGSPNIAIRAQASPTHVTVLQPTPSVLDTTVLSQEKQERKVKPYCLDPLQVTATPAVPSM
jgi:short-subunit dehydrogenase involved in D-alanine esterification of teichoic acids